MQLITHLDLEPRKGGSQPSAPLYALMALRFGAAILTMWSRHSCAYVRAARVSKSVQETLYPRTCYTEHENVDCVSYSIVTYGRNT
jgi:hypothetical protein